MTRGFRDSAEPALREGDIVGETYVIRRELARSETGAVFEAHDSLMDRIVALKLAWRDAGTPSLITEARRCAAVRDSCSVQVYGMGTHLGVEYAVAERIAGRLLADELDRALPLDHYLTRMRKLVAAVVHAHDAGIAVGTISGATVLVMAGERLVLGRLSLSQVPSFGTEGRDALAGQLDDIYSLGCIGLELAGARQDVPSELTDLFAWMMLENPASRPQSARDVLSQLDAVIDRRGTVARSLRVLVVDDDTARARWLWGLARRVSTTTIVETASEGTEAAHKLNRDQPDVVLIDASLRGVMNALELCMYARGLASDTHALGHMFVIGEVSERDQHLFDAAYVQTIPDDAQLPGAIIDVLRAALTARPRTRKPRTTVSG